MNQSVGNFLLQLSLSYEITGEGHVASDNRTTSNYSTLKMSRLNGKFALVTGGSQGIGFACIKELLNNGIQGVTLVDVNVSKGNESTALLKEEFGTERVIFIEGDVSKEDQVEDAFEKSFNHWKHLDIVINNAGVIAEQHWQKALLTNCGGTLQCSLTAFQYLSTKRNGRGGVIVNVASIVAVHPYAITPVYSSTKSFIVMLGRCLGDSIYHDHNGVRVVTVCPGLTITDFARNAGGLEALKSLVPHSQTSYNDDRDWLKSQSSEECAKHLVRLMIEGTSGSVWTIVGNEVSQVDFSIRD
uniref:15-hydroxyprostaglandin dehydrogenase n=3 Tax=Photinus pyralis TaxID=7054 RepID=A0A1Y1KEA8_PHOPY